MPSFPSSPVSPESCYSPTVPKYSECEAEEEPDFFMQSTTADKIEKHIATLYCNDVFGMTMEEASAYDLQALVK